MRLVTLWICLCAYLNCAGWLLSALHELNAGGYAAALALGLVAWLIWWKTSGAPLFPEFRLSKLRRRFRRGFPLAFLVLAGLAFCGGALYAPSNYDALAYRIPRILYWLSAGQWHWVHTSFDRINNRSCGIEWVSVPLIAFFHSTRPLFLINTVSFALLPGLVFTVFCRLGVRPRVAWHWMWLVPTGYCFILQSGSIGNDLFGALFALAAVDYALRARAGAGLAAAGVSILGAAMMTAAKTNNLPLLLPWAVALLPSLKTLLQKPAALAAVCLFAIGASGLPTIYFNLKMSGDWSGAKLSSPGVPHALEFRTAANIFSLSEQNLTPPVFPIADSLNKAIKQHLPPAVRQKSEALIELPGCWFPMVQMQTEEASGFGFGLTVLLAFSGLAVVARLRPALAGWRLSWPLAVRWASVISFAALLTQSNVSAIGRLFAAYYVLPCTVILAMPGQERVVRRQWWRVMGWMVFALAAVLVVISPARPLFPRSLVLDRLHPWESKYPKLVRLDDVYSVYQDRPQAFAPVLAALPSDLRILGYMAFDRPEATLWAPFGSRTIVSICPEDTPADARARGVSFILVDADEFETWYSGSLSDWLARMNAVVVREFPLRLRAASGPERWCLVQLR
jgi:hypothetical protein